MQHRASAYKHRTLGFVTSPFVATALSISASILFTPLLLNIYPHANSTVSEEAGIFTGVSLFLLCLSSPKKERKVWLCWHVCLSWAKERGDYVRLYVCLTRCLAPGNAMTAAAVTAEIMNWWLSTNTQNGILRFLWLLSELTWKSATLGCIFCSARWPRIRSCHTSIEYVEGSYVDKVEMYRSQ